MRYHGVDQRLGVVGRRRRDPRGPPPAGGVAVEGELAHHEHRAGRVGHGTIHHAALVGHDPQVPELLRQPAGMGFGVVVRDADQHAQPGADGAHQVTVDGRPTPPPPVAPPLAPARTSRALDNRFLVRKTVLWEPFSSPETGPADAGLVAGGMSRRLGLVASAVT